MSGPTRPMNMSSTVVRRPVSDSPGVTFIDSPTVLKALTASNMIDRNDRARRFYENAGFRADGAEKHQTFGGADVRELRYRLSR